MKEKRKTRIFCCLRNLNVNETGLAYCVRARERPEDGIDNEFQHSQRGAESRENGLVESAHP